MIGISEIRQHLFFCSVWIGGKSDETRRHNDLYDFEWKRLSVKKYFGIENDVLNTYDNASSMSLTVSMPKLMLVREWLSLYASIAYYFKHMKNNEFHNIDTYANVIFAYTNPNRCTHESNEPL